jgi:hypothetical protein
MAAVCACVAFLVYANTLHHEYAMDDYPTIYGNRLTMAGVHGIPTLLHTAYWYGLDGMNDWLYRPLSMLLFATEWQLAPNTPALGHWVNVLLYALSGYLLFRFVCRLLDTDRVAIPFAIALLWIVHPLHTEVVANIKSSDELLAFLFSILTLSEGLMYAREPRTRHLILAGLYLFLALLAKESAITLVMIVPLTLFVFTRAGRPRIGRAMIPVGLTALVYLVIRGAVLTSQTGDGGISLIDNSLMAATDLAHRLATASAIAGRYIGLLLFPAQLSSDYSFRQIPMVGFDDPLAFVSAVVYLALGVFGVMRVMKRDPIGYGILFYLIGIGLVANVFLLTHSTMAERFLYTPSLGFCIAVVMIAARAFGLDGASSEARVGATTRARAWAFATMMGLILVAGVVRSAVRNPEWRNDTTLFSADSRHSPNSARIHFLYGNHMLQELKQGKVRRDRQRAYYAIALGEFHQAIALYPAYAEPHLGIGDAYMFANDFGAAIDWYRSMVARNAGFATGYSRLGTTFAQMQQYDSAAVYLKRALAIEPRNGSIAQALSLAYQSSGDTAMARRYLQRAAALGGAPGKQDSRQ